MSWLVLWVSRTMTSCWVLTASGLEFAASESVVHSLGLASTHCDGPGLAVCSAALETKVLRPSRMSFSGIP